MRKLLTATLLLVAFQSIGQITPTNNRFKYNWLNGAWFSDSLFLKYLDGASEDKLLLLKPSGGLDTVAIDSFGGTLDDVVKRGNVYYGDTATSSNNILSIGNKGFLTLGETNQFARIYNVSNQGGLARFWISDIYTQIDSTVDVRSRGKVLLARTADNTKQDPQFCFGGGDGLGNDYLQIRWDAWNGNDFRPRTAQINFEATEPHRKDTLPSRMEFSVTDPYSSTINSSVFLEYYGLTYAGQFLKDNPTNPDIGYEKWKDTAFSDPWAIVPKKYIDSVASGADIQQTSAINFPAVSASSNQGVSVVVSGAAVGDNVTVNADVGFYASGLMLQAYVSAINEVTVQAFNITGSPVDPAEFNFYILVQK